MRNFTRCLCLSMLAFTFLAISLKAEPVTITAGSTATINFGGSSFNLNDSNGTHYVGTSIGGGNLPTYQPGSIFTPVVNIFNTFGYNDFRGVYLNGTWNPVIYAGINSSMVFSSLSFQLPSILSNTFSVTIPFTMQGNLVATIDCTVDFQHCNQVVANNAISGNGNVTYNFANFGNGVWQMTGANYVFGTPTNPTPEPSTIILLGTGLIGIAGYARKRMRKKSE